MRAVENQEWQGNTREFTLQPFVGLDHLRNRACRLRLVCDERIVVDRLYDGRVTREVLVLEMEDVRMRSDVSKPLEHREREIGRRDLERKALTDEARELCLMVEGVKARDHAASAMTEQKDLQVSKL